MYGSRLRAITLLLLLLSSRGAAQAGATAPAPDGAVLIHRVNAAHRATWFTTLTFVQRARYPGTDRPDETWYETMVRPGYLRIDVERDGRMVSRSIFRQDSLYTAQAGEPPVGRPQVHELLVLLHDLHVAEPDVVVRKLRGLGFDLDRTSRGEWDGRPVTVVGATAGDSTSRQFWLDDSLQVVVRVLHRRPNGTVSDVRISDFLPAGGGLLEQAISFRLNGRVTLDETYRLVRTGMTIPMQVFEPAEDRLPGWVQRLRDHPARSVP